MAIVLTIPWPTGGTATVTAAASTNPLLARLELERLLEYDGDYNYLADILVHVEARILDRAAPLRFDAVYVHCAGPYLRCMSACDPVDAEAMELVAAAAGPAMDVAVWQRYVELVDEAVASGRIRRYAGVRQSERERVSRKLAALTA